MLISLSKGTDVVSYFNNIYFNKIGLYFIIWICHILGMLYNNDTFNKYCDNNEIKLLENYEQIKLNREYRINGMCITCDWNNEFDKSFRQLIKTGAYCYNCCVNNGKQQWELICKYNIEHLLHFCEEINITLNNNYDNEIINRDTIINGKWRVKYLNYLK
jgi:hypothetical protein